MAKKFRPVVTETPQSRAAIRGRGASWSPANRFEKLHIDLNDVDVVDVDPETEERPQRGTQYFRDETKSVITRNNSPDVGFETSLNPYRGCEHVTIRARGDVARERIRCRCLKLRKNAGRGIVPPNGMQCCCLPCAAIQTIPHQRNECLSRHAPGNRNVTLLIETKGSLAAILRV